MRLGSIAVVTLLTSLFPPQQPQNLGPPESYGERIVVRKDIPFAAKSQDYQKLDLYLPPGNGPFPVVVWYFGGGFTGGNKARSSRQCAYLASRGFAVAAPNYYLANADQDRQGWPRNIHDAKCVVRFLREHAEKYHLDGKRIAAAGHSSGAYLALMVGLTADKPDLEGNLGWPRQSSHVSAIVDVAGVCDRRAGLGTGTRHLLGKGYEQNVELRRLASPVTHVAAKSPPVYLLHGDADKVVLVDSSHQLAQVLEQQQVPHKLHVVKGAGHNPVSVDTLKSVADWLGQRLQPR